MVTTTRELGIRKRRGRPSG